MRPRSFALASLPVLLTGLIVGCGQKPPAAEKTTPSVGPAQPDAANTNVGSPLYAAVPPPSYTTTIARDEPIVITPALVSFEERQVIAAEVDGTIDLIATPVSLDVARKLPEGQLVYHPRDTLKEFPYKRIGESDEVKNDQVIALLDEQQITAKRDGAAKIKLAAEIARVSAEKGAEAAGKRYDLTKRANDQTTGSQKEVLDDQLTLQRFVENLATAQQTIAKAEQEFKESSVLLAKHKIKSRVNGVVRSIAKRPGEYVKAGEKIMEIEATDRVRIEGNLDVQYASRVHRGMKVIVEPAVPSAPIAAHQGHRQPVTGVAVAVATVATEDRTELVPLVISVGADGGALVWEPNLQKKNRRPSVPHNLPHPVGVRSVAATPPTAKTVLVITGADDGKIRIWDVSNPDRLPTEPKTEPTDAHTSGVQAIAVSPDGRHFATVAGRDVFVWELASAKKLYALPIEHRDNVTAVSFTPQNTLITASKDGTLKVWALGTERAAVIRTLDHRAGTVEVLGVSRDGGRVLFDQDKSRLDLVDPANGQTIGQVQNVTSAGAFSTVAIFGPDEVPPGTPDDKLPPYTLATVGGDGDLKGTLQFWHAPRSGGRGAEVGRLITPGRAGITTAAFSPVRGESFLVVGTTAGGVLLWKPPTGERKMHEGRVTFIDQTDARYVTVRVEMSNTELNLLDHSAATIIILPKDR